MDQNSQQQNQAGPGGRRLHIAHRRSPSELTPLMMEQLALQQQIEMLQVQQQHMLNAQQYMGVLPGQNQFTAGQFNQLAQLQHLVPQQQHNFQQFGQQGAPVGAPTQPASHRRNQSAMPGMGGLNGPPPAPSSGSSGAFGDFSLGTGSANRENNPRRNQGQGGQSSGSAPAGAGHQRRHSLALPEAKKAAELAQAKRNQGPSTGGALASGSAAVSSTPNAPQASNTSSSPAAAEAPVPASNAPASNTQTASNPPAQTRGRGGHMRSQSLAVGGRGPATGRLGSFQFPPPAATTDNIQTGTQNNSQGVERRSSNSNFQGHQRTGSRNYDNWRQPNNNQQDNNNQQQQQHQQQQQQQNQQQQFQNTFQPGHRARPSMGNSISQYNFPGTPVLIPGAGGQGFLINPATGQPLLPAQLLQQQPLNALQLQQAALGNPLMNANVGSGGQSLSNQQQQVSRKTLFTPYLPQASLPALLSNGQLVSGILRVNKKNRSDAYVSTQDGLLESDIFICGSKDRNRALEGDLVAVELLDVDEVWGQKREKEEKKKRKDISDTRGNQGDGQGSEGGLRRRGSLKQRAPQKKNDDVEVEGQALLLVEEEEISDEHKPLYAGHIVAVIERVAGQMFSGTLGLLRPSSQATKEKQEAERQAREGTNSRPQHSERNQEKPKIVWFKPTDKRVPLIAIPTEQAPRDFVENHQSYANKIFVACIKRWPITSLHPFGTLVEQLGEMGDVKIETDAVLRDNNFGPDEFADAVTKSVALDNWSISSEEAEPLAARRDFRDESLFTVIPREGGKSDTAYHVKKLDENTVEIGIHVADVSHFVKPNSLVDREARKRGTGVNLINRTVPLLPSKLSDDILSLESGNERLAVSVVFQVDPATGSIKDDQTWIGKSIVKSSKNVTFDQIDDALLYSSTEEDIAALRDITTKFRKARYGIQNGETYPLSLLSHIDDEAVPVRENIFTFTPSQEIVEELQIKANAAVADKLLEALPEKALLRRHADPNVRRITTFADRMNKLGLNIDISDSSSLHRSVFNQTEDNRRKALQTLLVKTMQRGKYIVASKMPVEGYKHFVNNLPRYTHFTNPTRRYVDIVVHRQLSSVITAGASEFVEDVESLAKMADQCNVKKDSAKNAQEQSIHFQLCRAVDQVRLENGGELIREAIVLNVYESAFDVLIPEYGFEKRVHCDQLPLKKAEFDKSKRILELYWEKGVQSNVYIPEDERPKGMAAMRAANAQAAAAQAAAAAKAAQEQEEMQRKMMEVSTLSTNDVDALFDDEDDEEQPAAEAKPESTPSAAASASQSAPAPTARETASSQQAASLKEKYGHMFTLREEKGEYIQEVRELTMVPVFLKTDLSKSPPCLTIRSLNPYAF